MHIDGQTYNIAPYSMIFGEENINNKAMHFNYKVNNERYSQSKSFKIHNISPNDFYRKHGGIMEHVEYLTNGNNIKYKI